MSLCPLVDYSKRFPIAKNLLPHSYLKVKFQSYVTKGKMADFSYLKKYKSSYEFKKSHMAVFDIISLLQLRWKPEKYHVTTLIRKYRGQYISFIYMDQTNHAKSRQGRGGELGGLISSGTKISIQGFMGVF